MAKCDFKNKKTQEGDRVKTTVVLSDHINCESWDEHRNPDGCIHASPARYITEGHADRALLKVKMPTFIEKMGKK